MKATYSIYEAKSKLSEIVRQVKQRRTVTITERGVPVALVTPIAREAGIAGRLQELQQSGLLTEAKASRDAFAAIAPRPGALSRFLAERE